MFWRITFTLLNWQYRIHVCISISKNHTEILLEGTSEFICHPIPLPQGRINPLFRHSRQMFVFPLLQNLQWQIFHHLPGGSISVLALPKVFPNIQLQSTLLQNPFYRNSFWTETPLIFKNLSIVLDIGRALSCSHSQVSVLQDS